MSKSNRSVSSYDLFYGLREAALQDRNFLRHHRKSRELATEIQSTRRKAFLAEDELIQRGIEAIDPELVLEAIERKAKRFTLSGPNLGDPSSVTDSDYSLDPHRGKFTTKEAQKDLQARFTLVYDAVQRARDALSRNNRDLAFALAWQAERALRKVEDFYVQFAELNGIVAALVRTKRRSSKESDEIEFQKRCEAHWAANRDTPITGDNGIVYEVGGELLGKYPESTLVKRAREVAPPWIKGRNGRRKKKP